MQNLISLIFLLIGVAIFYLGYTVGKDAKREPKQDGSFFTPLPSVPKMEDVPAKQQEKEDKANRFYK
jgi:hypothetical protein